MARSAYHTILEAKLEKHAKQHAKQKRNAFVSNKVSKQVIKTIGKNKQAAKAKCTSKSSKPAADPQEPKAKASETEATKSTEAAKTTTPAAPNDPNLKFWDVSGYQVRMYKNWVTVRIDGTTIRKFLFQEWQDGEVAKQIATCFAKAARKEILLFRAVKAKTEKIEIMKKHGINLEGKETVAKMEILLQEAGHWAQIYHPTPKVCHDYVAGQGKNS